MGKYKVSSPGKRVLRGRATATAYFVYGVIVPNEGVKQLPWCDLADEDGYFGDDEEEGGIKPSFQDWLAQNARLSNPSVEVEETDEAWQSWIAVPENAAAVKEYERKCADLIAACPIQRLFYDVEIGLIVAINKPFQKASWSKPIRADLAVNECAVRAATGFCARHRIPFHKPGWILVTLYD